MPLLTDTLPYEVPVLFSNRGLYETIKNAYNTYYDEIVRNKAQGIDCDIPTTIERFLKDKFISDPSLIVLRERIEELFKKPLVPYEYMIVKNQKNNVKLRLYIRFRKLKYAISMQNMKMRFYSILHEMTYRYATQSKKHRGYLGNMPHL